MLYLIDKTRWLHEELKERTKDWRKIVKAKVQGQKCNKSLVELGYKVKTKDANDSIGVNWKLRKQDYKQKGWKCIERKFKD